MIFGTDLYLRFLGEDTSGSNETQDDEPKNEMNNQILPEVLHDELVWRNAYLNGLFFTKNSKL